MSEKQNYPLGYSTREAQRLADQAAQVEELTEDVLRRAGQLPQAMRTWSKSCAACCR